MLLLRTQLSSQASLQQTIKRRIQIATGSLQGCGSLSCVNPKADNLLHHCFVHLLPSSRDAFRNAPFDA